MLDLGYTHEKGEGNIDYNDVNEYDNGYTTVEVKTVYQTPRQTNTTPFWAQPEMALALIDYIDYTGADSGQETT